MQQAERWRRQKLDSTIDRLDGAEARALADLRAAGFKFQTIDQARRHRSQLRAVDQFQRDGDFEQLEVSLHKSDKARRTA